MPTTSSTPDDLREMAEWLKLFKYVYIPPERIALLERAAVEWSSMAQELEGLRQSGEHRLIVADAVDRFRHGTGPLLDDSVLGREITNE